MMFMPYIIGLVAALCLFNDAWRRTAFIVLCVSLFNIFVVSPFIVPEYILADDSIHPDLYFVAGLIDAITAYLILKIGRGGKYLQAGVLSLFVLTNACLLIALKQNSLLVYDYYYEWLIFALNILQVSLFWQGLTGAMKRIWEYVESANGMVAGNNPNISRVRYSDHGSHKENMESRK